MANELLFHYPTGNTLNVYLSNEIGQIYNGSTFEAPASANWATYGIAMTEAATATGIYRADMPAVAAGAYGWVVRKQAGGSSAVSDITVGAGSIRWTGTAEEAVPAAVNVTEWKGATAPAMTGDTFARLGAPAGASVSADIAAIKADTAAILVDTDQTLPALFAASGATVTVISAVSGGTITVYVGDTWRFTLLSEELTLNEYEVLGLVVKRSEKQADDDALLYLRTDDGLVRIGGAAPVDAANGELTKTANSFSTLVHLAETQELVAGSYLWWLKAFDTSVEPSEAKTLATGGFALKRGGLGAVA